MSKKIGEVILDLQNISLRFGGVKALTDISFNVKEHEIRAIIGPNGAGKTTMMDLITGKIRPDQGTLFFDTTHDLTRLDEAGTARLGIGRKFQKPTVIESLSLGENIDLALAGPRDVWSALRGPDPATAARERRRLLDLVRLADPDRLAEVARAKGFRSIFGDVLGKNAKMLRLMHSLGFLVQPHPEENALRRVVKALHGK